MGRKVAGMVLCLGCAAACGGDDPPSFGQVSAAPEDCPNGGQTLLVDGKPQITVCNGAVGPKGDTGATGETGLEGEPGARGAAGMNALVAADVIQGIEARSAAVVIVQCTADGVNFEYGTGTKTPRGTVYTAEHVTAGMTTCGLFSESPITALGSTTVFTQKGVRDQVELTVTWTAAGQATPALTPKLATVPDIGEFIAIVGHPGLYDGLTLEHQYTTGLVTATNLQATFDSVPVLAGKSTAWQTGWSTDAIAWHGNSGGPAFNQQGEWIGMLVGAFNGAADNEGPDLSVVIPLF